MASRDLRFDEWSQADRTGSFTAYDETLDMSRRRRRPHVSFSATLGLIVSLIALCAR
jgi:hypothetical protein